MSCQAFQAVHHGGHLGYLNETNLAILNLHVSQMPRTKFKLNPTYRSGADVVWRFSRLPLWRPSWIAERNDFSNSEFLCCSSASHQVSAQSNLRFGRCPSWISERNDFSNSNSPCGPNASHHWVLAQSDIGFGSRCGFKMAAQAILAIRTERF